MKLKLTIVLTPALAVLSLSACGGTDEEGSAPPSDGGAARIGSTKATHKSFDASLKAATHSPRTGRPWRWSVKVTTKNGKPLAARSQTLFVFAGKIVGRGGRDRFFGFHHERIRWPKRSVGFPLVFRIALKTAKGGANLDYPVQVRG